MTSRASTRESAAGSSSATAAEKSSTALRTSPWDSGAAEAASSGSARTSNTAVTTAAAAAPARTAMKPRCGAQARWRRSAGACGGGSQAGPRALVGSTEVTIAAVGASAGAAAPVATVRSSSVTGSPEAAASAARPRSPVDGKRSSGALASARAITASNSGGTGA